MGAGVDLAHHRLAVVDHGEPVEVEAAEADRASGRLGGFGQDADEILFVGLLVLVPAFVCEQLPLGGRGVVVGRGRRRRSGEQQGRRQGRQHGSDLMDERMGRHAHKVGIVCHADRIQAEVRADRPGDRASCLSPRLSASSAVKVRQCPLRWLPLFLPLPPGYHPAASGGIPAPAEGCAMSSLANIRKRIIVGLVAGALLSAGGVVVFAERTPLLAWGCALPGAGGRAGSGGLGGSRRRAGRGRRACRARLADPE